MASNVRKTHWPRPRLCSDTQDKSPAGKNATRGKEIAKEIATGISC